MNGINELITVAKYWQKWGDPRLIFLVLNNRDLNQVTWEMRIEEGYPTLSTTQSLPDFPYARFADALGLKGLRVDRPEEIGRAWDAALLADRPVVLEAVTSGDAPTIPPHISFEQAKEYTTALVKGDPDEGGIIKQSVKDLVGGMLPHKDK